MTKGEHLPDKTVVAQLPRVEFDNIELKTTADDEPEVPVLTKAPDTSDLVSKTFLWFYRWLKEDECSNTKWSRSDDNFLYLDVDVPIHLCRD